MKRTTVMVDEGTYAEMERYARLDEVSIGALIREAMTRYVALRLATGPPRSLPPIVGIIAVPTGPAAADLEAVLEAEWPSELAAERDASWSDSRSAPAEP